MFEKETMTSYISSNWKFNRFIFSLRFKYTKTFVLESKQTAIGTHRVDG